MVSSNVGIHHRFYVFLLGISVLVEIIVIHIEGAMTIKAEADPLGEHHSLRVFELVILKLCTGSNIVEADNRPLSPMMRAEVQKLDKYIEEYKPLCDNKFESPKELLLFQEDLSVKITTLEQERYTLRLKLRRVKTPEEDAALKTQAKEITKQITPLRKQRDIARRIEEHIPRIKELLDAERQIEMKHNNLKIKKERGYLEYVCVNPLGDIIKPQYVTEHFKVILRKNGMEQIRFHDLRHPYVKSTTKNIYFFLSPRSSFLDRDFAASRFCSAAKNA